MANVNETQVTPESVEAELCDVLGCESLDEASKSLIPTAIELSKLSHAALVAANLMGVRNLPEKKAEPVADPVVEPVVEPEQPIVEPEPDNAEIVSGGNEPEEPALTTEADAIRAALNANPTATNAEIIKQLAASGVTVTSSQVSGIKRKIKESQS